MFKERCRRIVFVFAVLCVGVAAAQYPIVDAVANKIVQKYQGSSCEQLWQERAQQQGKPKSPAEQRAVELLHNDPQAREAFINKIAAPIANKMFECGMIP